VQYQVRLFDPTASSVREETREAENRAALDEQLRGCVVLAVRRTGFQFRARDRSLDVAWWCRELRTLLGAGMTVVEAMETLNAQSTGAARVRVHALLVDRLRQGQALSAAMQAANVFPAVLIAGIKASERTSALVEALDEYLRYHDMIDRLRKQVVSAAIYPAVVVSLGGLISLFLLLYVIPRFSLMYADHQAAQSGATRLLIGLSSLLNSQASLVLACLAALGVGILAAWKAGLVARATNGLAARIGPLQRQLDQFRLAKLYHALALMFRGGYTLDDALRHCDALDLGLRVQQGVLAAHEALTRGQGVSVALAGAGLADPVSTRLLAVGERSGNFDVVLQTIAERHAAQFGTFIERATRIVEPLLLLLVALVVGGIVVMMYMPIFDIASGLR
jgi:general secretion pathway protein F